jgi:prepilin signal peptidase PulO-like enzyme (type II secretory pathway)
VVFPASALALVYNIYRSVQGGDFGFHSPLIQGLIGVALISGFFALQYYISKGRWIGFGDVKLGIFLGLIFGLGQSLMLLFMAYCLGAVVGVGLIALGFKKLGSQMPFGTFLGFSAIIMILIGSQIVNWYLRLIGL